MTKFEIERNLDYRQRLVSPLPQNIWVSGHEESADANEEETTAL